MIIEILLSICGLSLMTTAFVSVSLWGTKILYSHKLKDLHKNKNELVSILNARLLNLELENKKDEDEYLTLSIILKDLINKKD